jgi:hypothetical protein
MVRLCAPQIDRGSQVVRVVWLCASVPGCVLGVSCMSVTRTCHGVSAYLSVYGMCVSAYLSASATAQTDMRVLYPSHAWYAFLTMSWYEFLAL